MKAAQQRGIGEYLCSPEKVCTTDLSYELSRGCEALREAEPFSIRGLVGWLPTFVPLGIDKGVHDSGMKMVREQKEPIEPKNIFLLLVIPSDLVT